MNPKETQTQNQTKKNPKNKLSDSQTKQTNKQTDFRACKQT